MPWAREQFDPTLTYGEISPSGKGVKFFCRGTLTGDGVRRKGFGPGGAGGVELYDRGHYFAVTGRRYHESPADVRNCAGQVAALYSSVKATRKPNNLAGVTTPANPHSSNAEAFRRCRAYLERCPDAVSGSGGHDATIRAACECYRFGLSDSDAGAMMDWFNVAKCQPAWSAAELRHKLTDARAKVLNDGEFGKKLSEGRAAVEPFTFTGSAAAAAHKPAHEGLEVINMADIESEDVRWLWPERIATGCLSVLAGSASGGKGLVTMDLTARVTTGRAFPDGAAPEVGSVIILSGEDDPARHQATARSGRRRRAKGLCRQGGL